MFGDIGWAELLLIGIVALIVIGPEDLPDMFRQLGRFTAKLRSMSRDFSRAMEQAAKDSGVKDVANDLKAVTSPKALGLNKVKEAADRFEKWDPIKNAAKPTQSAAKPLVPAPMPATPAPVVAVEPVIHGPETQALIDKQAAKKAIVAETSEKLKAVDAVPAAGADTPAAPKPAPPKAAVKPRAKKATAPPVDAVVSAESAETPAAAPQTRAPRKTNKADEA